ncbi:MAG: hypothetical protein K0S32_2709 [Bacteroidetes bacterium]|jgi:hypothetical protein|nr:hypothetical protein [Bacteroidota bacterium]
MKKSNLFLLAFLFLCNISIFAQQNKTTKQTPPTDAPSGFTYDYDLTQNLIVDRLTNPNESNKDVQVFISEKNFPAFKQGDKVDGAYREKLKIWMEKNPGLIINTLKHRTNIVKPF